MSQVEEYRTVAAKVFDAAIFQSISSETINKRPQGNPKIFDNSPASINEIVNKLNYIRGGQYRLTQLLDALNEKASNLLIIIKEKYNLD